MSTYVLTYNGITLPFSHIDTFEQVPEYSDDGTDVLYIHTTITGRGLLNQCINDGQNNVVPNGVYLNTLRQSLLVPRQNLTFTIDGNPVIAINGPDANNGPKPSNMKFVQIIGNTILVDFTIETWTLACTSEGSSGPGTPINPIISNRWTQSTEIDKDGLSTLTTTGTLLVPASAGVNPDSLRNLIFPITTIPVGFQRERQDYSISSDGLTWTYTIVDREQFRPSTDGITSWTGSWTESGTVGNIVTGTLNLTITAKKSVSKTDMFTTLGKLIRSRIYQYDIPSSFSITEGLSENTITFSMTVLCLTNRSPSTVTNSNGKILEQFTMIPGADGTLQQLTRIGSAVNPFDGADKFQVTTIGTRECYLTQLLINTISGTCANKNTLGVKNYVQGTTALPTPYGTACTVNVTSVSAPTTSQTTATAQTVQFPYLKYQIEKQYEENQNSLMLAQGLSTVVAGGGGPAGNVNLASKQINTGASETIVKVKFHLERLNSLPEIPKPTINGQPVVCQTSRVVEPNPIVLPSGSDFIWTTYGEYTFIQPISQNVSYGANLLVVPTSPVTGLVPQPVPNASFNSNFLS